MPRMWYTCASKVDLSYNNQGEKPICYVEELVTTGKMIAAAH
jgi:hypothetical protein